jgi:hypothetical protein
LAKSSFGRIRGEQVKSGRSERPSRQPRLFATAARSAFKRLTPQQNVKLGFSPKARHYVLKTTKRLTKTTPTISARQYEAKRAGELFGLTPERATEARRQGAISYITADQRERVAKAARTRVVNRVAKAASAREHVPNNSPNPRRHGRSFALRPGAADRYRELKGRKLAGETLPDGDWHWMMDVASYFDDPDLAVLRGSPGAFGIGFAA